MVPHALRQAKVYQEDLHKMRLRVDAAFVGLVAAHWGAGVILACWVAPRVWIPWRMQVHTAWPLAIGSAVSGLCLWLLQRRPGLRLTHNTAAATLAMWCGLYSQFSAGHLETQLYIFIALYFLSGYRAWSVLLTGTAVLLLDHLWRGQFWPQSVYGSPEPAWQRTAELAAWVGLEDFVLFMGIRDACRELWTMADRQARLERSQESTEAKVTERTKQLRDSREQYRLIAESANVIPFTYLAHAKRFTYVGPQATRIVGYDMAAWLEPEFFAHKVDPAHAGIFDCGPDTADDFRFEGEFSFAAADGRMLHLRTAAGVGRVGGRPCVRGILLDMTAMRQLETELRHAQKLESVGRLAAGIAHEINTPVQFVNDSVHFVRDAMRDLHGLVHGYEALAAQVLAGTATPQAARALAERAHAMYWSDLQGDVPQALERAIEGLNRIALIVRSMKEFAHPDATDMARTDLNQAIRSTLTIAGGELKYVADLHTDLGDIPHVRCYASEVNQVILNLLVNAAHAVGDKVQGTAQRGTVSVRTERAGDCVAIAVSDTGAGIPEPIRQRIFDPFFTTKAVGRGSGQGLAIARAVVQRHGGRLTFTSEVGKGSTFVVHLPIEGPRQKARKELNA